jgi:flagellar M-ring protein FliF
MTAAIVLNDRLLRAASKNSSAQWQPWSGEQLHNLTLLAQAAVGFDSTRGDVLTIEDLAFDGNRAPPQVSVPARMLTAAERSPVLVKYFALLAGLLVIVVLGVRPALKLARGERPPVAKEKATIKEMLNEATDTERPVLEIQEPAALDPERIRAQEIFEQVTGHLKREPTQSSRLLQSWIHSE